MNGQYKRSEEFRKKMSIMRRRPIQFLVDEKGCHICTSHKRSSFNGYPVIRKGKIQIPISHLIYEEVSGNPVPKGMCVCHTCDTPPCINYKHFFLGTPLDNAQDRESKGRGRNSKGEANVRAKLTETDVINIRNNSRKDKELAAEYSISVSTVGRIKNRKAWKHI